VFLREFNWVDLREGLDENGNELKSPKKGTVKKLHVTAGAAVEAGQVLAEVE
jgi:multidrug efflux pump subunit AcrA (membrane-fusion protein)